jgi:exopolysaccharide biosynthesis polyprenyl glycosylphosphotransferase
MFEGRYWPFICAHLGPIHREEMQQVDPHNSGRAVALPRLWVQRRPRTSRERLHSWKVASLLIDVLMMVFAAVAFDFFAVAEATPLGWRVVFSCLVLVLFASRRLYATRLRVQFVDDLPRAVASTAFAAMIVITLRLLVENDPLAEETVYYWLFAGTCLVTGRAATHVGQARERRRGIGNRPTLIVGAGKVAHLTAKRLLDRPELGLQPVGFLDKEPLDMGDHSVGLRVLGASWDLDRIISEYGVEHVIVTFSTAPDQVLVGLTRRCAERGVSVSLVPRLFEVEGSKITAEHIGGLPLISVDVTDPKGWQFTIKYAIDRIVAALVLLFTLPLFAVLSLAVLVTMGRPIFYRQQRVGRDGHVFDMLKFRTMRGRPEEAGEADVDWAMQEINGRRPSLGSVTGDETSDETTENGQGFTGPAADRRTPLGRILRKFSLDELPQFLNVLRGDMSLVGPRPERASYVEQFQNTVYRYGDRHRVKSGITGWAQVQGLRGKTSLHDRVEWDNHYVANWSPWFDIKIVMQTVACVLRGQTGDK